MISLRLQTGSQRGHKQLILSLLWTQFLSREISYNFKVAIIGHLHCTEFDRNDRPIFSLYQSVKTHGLVSTDFFEALLSQGFGGDFKALLAWWSSQRWQAQR